LGVALGVKGANASTCEARQHDRLHDDSRERLRTVLAPFVLPEGLCGSTVGHPVVLHVAQEIGLAIGLEDLSDVGVGTRGIAVGFVGAIAVVRL
jgi:hypothetical protein